MPFINLQVWLDQGRQMAGLTISDAQEGAEEKSIMRMFALSSDYHATAKVKYTDRNKK